MHINRFVRDWPASIVCWAAVLWFVPCLANAEALPFFSGAEGFGGSWAGTAPAGGWLSNATVYHVTNLNDSGPGSLRGAFQENSSNKIIVFDVAGTIQLTSGSLNIKNLSNYYIAGQTAPGPVTVYGDTTQITHSSSKLNTNVILRYLTFRKGAGNGEDAITFAGGSGSGDMVASNMILDHVSASWSEDEILSVANNNTNVTVQYSMIHDALVSGHAYGSLIRPRIDSNVTFHHNLYAHNASRQARFGTYNSETLTADFRNNVVYNWRDRASYAGGSSEAEREFADVNFVGNYFIAGPGTGGNTTHTFIVDRNVDARVHQSGNFVDSDKLLNPVGQPNGSDSGWGMFQVQNGGALTQMSTPFTTAIVTTQSANDAYWQIIDYVGNWWWTRDAIDARVIGDVLNNTNAPNGIGASVPPPAELNSLLAAPVLTRPTGWDTDEDGMPDAWEAAHGLSPTSADDNLLDFDNDGYVNLLEYLDEVAAFTAPAPIVFDGTTDSRYAVITNWKTNEGVTAGSPWQPSRFDEAQINSGTVSIDAVGQHARVLKIGANLGDSATLNITSGWLKVEEELIIGADAGATANLNLSGGVLLTPTLNKGVNGSFHFTGGVLHADEVGFELVNNGGTFAPGNSISTTHVAGDLQLNSGALQIELASSSAADALVVDGKAMLGGSLEVLPLDGFTPAPGDNWPILAADSILGQFAAITAGYSLLQQDDELRLYFGPAPPVGLPGDFNDDGRVDVADYVVWRAGLGTTYTPADYEVWRAHFGAVAAGGPLADPSGGLFAAVPEPKTWVLLSLPVVVGLNCRRARLTARSLRILRQRKHQPDGKARPCSHQIPLTAG